MARKRRHLRVTVIIQKVFPLVPSHHWRGLMYSRPNRTLLDAAAMRPSSLWDCFTVRLWPSFIAETSACMDSTCAGDIRARIVRFPGTMVFWEGVNTSSLCSVSAPSTLNGPERHLDAELPSLETGLI